MDTIVFGQYTAQDLLAVAVVSVGFLVALILLKRLFTRKEGSPHAQLVKCMGCGWQGVVSRYAGRCPKCNTPLGDQKARP